MTDATPHQREDDSVFNPLWGGYEETFEDLNRSMIPPMSSHLDIDPFGLEEINTRVQIFDSQTAANQYGDYSLPSPRHQFTPWSFDSKAAQQHQSSAQQGSMLNNGVFPAEEQLAPGEKALGNIFNLQPPVLSNPNYGTFGILHPHGTTPSAADVFTASSPRIEATPTPAPSINAPATPSESAKIKVVHSCDPPDAAILSHFKVNYVKPGPKYDGFATVKVPRRGGKTEMVLRCTKNNCAACKKTETESQLTEAVAKRFGLSAAPVGEADPRKKKGEGSFGTDRQEVLRSATSAENAGGQNGGDESPTPTPQYFAPTPPGTVLEQANKYNPDVVMSDGISSPLAPKSAEQLGTTPGAAAATRNNVLIWLRERIRTEKDIQLLVAAVEKAGALWPQVWAGIENDVEMS